MHSSTSDLVTIIVPVYKTKEFLNKCIDSIVHQTYKDLQIILVDDGSPDECGAICDDWAKRDKRVYVIHKENGGLSDARNAGVACAEGTYITFIDSDDWIEEDYVSYLMEGILNYDAQVSVCNLFTVRDGRADPWRKPDNRYRVMTSVDAVKDMMYGHSFDTSACAKMYHRSCFDSIRFPVGRLYEEVATTYRLLLSQKRVAVGMRPLYNYVKHSNSIVTSRFSPSESPLDCKEIQPVHSEGDQPWDFFGGNDAKAETPVLWPPLAKS